MILESSLESYKLLLGRRMFEIFQPRMRLSWSTWTKTTMKRVQASQWSPSLENHLQNLLQNAHLEVLVNPLLYTKSLHTVLVWIFLHSVFSSHHLHSGNNLRSDKYQFVKQTMNILLTHPRKKIRSNSVLTRPQQIVWSSLGWDNVCSHVIFQEMLRTKETMIMN